MKRMQCPFFAAFLFIVVFCQPVFSFDGPLEGKNQFPLFLPLNSPWLESASIENSFAVRLSYSSINMIRRSSEWDIRLDMEIAELDLRLKKKLNRTTELGIEVPFFSFNDGFLDRPLSWYHGTFGFSDYGRKSRPYNEFLYEVRRNGRLVLKGKTGAGIGDIKLTSKWLLAKDDPKISLKAEFELPIGKASEGFGSGNIGAGAAILLDKKLANWMVSYFNLGVFYPGNLKADETIHTKTFWFAATGLETAVWNNFNIIGQIQAQGSPLPKTGIPYVDRHAVLLTLGGRYRTAANSFELSLTEDINTAGAPDFTLNFAYKHYFNL